MFRLAASAGRSPGLRCRGRCRTDAASQIDPFHLLAPLPGRMISAFPFRDDVGLHAAVQPKTDLAGEDEGLPADRSKAQRNGEAIAKGQAGRLRTASTSPANRAMDVVPDDL